MSKATGTKTKTTKTRLMMNEEEEEEDNWALDKKQAAKACSYSKLSLVNAK